MNGPEHYREAERLLGSLDQVERIVTRQRLSGADARFLADQVTARAQVHATLALAAATAAYRATHVAADGKFSESFAEGWAEVTS